MHRLRRRRHRKRLRSNKRHGVLGFCPARTALRRCRITYRVIRISWIVTCHILLHRFIIVNALHCASTSLNYHNIHNHSCNPINVYQHTLFIGITYPHLGRIITHSREFDSYQGDPRGRPGNHYSNAAYLTFFTLACYALSLASRSASSAAATSAFIQRAPKMPTSPASTSAGVQVINSAWLRYWPVSFALK